MEEPKVVKLHDDFVNGTFYVIDFGGRVTYTTQDLKCRFGNHKVNYLIFDKKFHYLRCLKSECIDEATEAGVSDDIIGIKLVEEV